MNDEEYIEKFVHPTLDKLGTALAQWMPSNPDEFARAWIMNDGNVPESMGAQREASADERKAFVTVGESTCYEKVLFEFHIL
jgi:hypothetical protein